MAPQRKDPCPCGSGKLYQDCCSNSQVADFQTHKWQHLAQKLQEELLLFAEDERFTMDSEDAFTLYLDTISDELFEVEEEPVFVSFVDWFIHDYPLEFTGGLNLIQYYAKERENQLGPMEQELLRDWAASYISLAGVEAVGEDWVVFEDLIVGGKYTVYEFNLAKGIATGSIILGRLVKIGENYRFTGAVLEFTPLLRREIVEIVNKFYRHWRDINPGKNQTLFLKEEGFRLPSLITAVLEGEETEWESGWDSGDSTNREWDSLSQQSLIQVLEYYYRRWTETGNSILENKTPRELSKTEAGRKELESFLEKLENDGEWVGGGRKTPADLDFDRIRTFLGLNKKTSGTYSHLDPHYREVNRLLEGSGRNRKWVKAAKLLWADFYHRAQPQVKKAAAWAAAVTYTMVRLFSNEELTQREIAECYQVAPGTVSSYYRNIWATLGLKRHDKRYTH